jgi:outer membrane protein assembly factor BamB
VTTPAAGPPAIDYKRCRTCGDVVAADRDRCPRCLANVVGAPPVEPDEAARRLGRQAAREAARIEADARRAFRLRLLRRGAAVVAVLLVGWWVYRNFIYEPPPLPSPSSTVRTLLATPDAWPASGGDLGGTRSTAAAPALDAPEAWRVDLGSPLATPLVADRERVYATLEDGRIVALGIEDGAIRWEHRLPVAPHGAPAIAGDRLYVALRAGQLVALDAATGDEVFASISISTTIGAAPLIDDGVAYLFGLDGIFGFDAETGEQLWRIDVDTNWAFVAPVLDDDHIAVTSGNRALVYDRLRGGETYFYEFERAKPYALVLHDGAILVASSRFAASLDLDARRPWWEGTRAVWNQFWVWQLAPDIPPPASRWVVPQTPAEDYSAALAGEHLILAGPSGDVLALDVVSGEPAWRLDLDPVTAPPLATDSGVLVVHDDRLALLDAATGAVTDERPIEGGDLADAIVTTGGTFVATASGSVVALR